MLIYLNTLDFPPLPQTLENELWKFLSGVTYHAPFFLCRQLTVYVKLVSHLPAPFVGCASPLGSLSWKKGKPTDCLRTLSEIRGWRPLWAPPAPHTALWPRSLGSARLLLLLYSSAFTVADSGAGSSPFPPWQRRLFAEKEKDLIFW